jgi:hypothetical protein
VPGATIAVLPLPSSIPHSVVLSPLTRAHIVFATVLASCFAQQPSQSLYRQSSFQGFILRRSSFLPLAKTFPTDHTLYRDNKRTFCLWYQTAHHFYVRDHPLFSLNLVWAVATVHLLANASSIRVNGSLLTPSHLSPLVKYSPSLRNLLPSEFFFYHTVKVTVNIFA